MTSSEELVNGVASALFKIRSKLAVMSEDAFRKAVDGAFRSVEGHMKHRDISDRLEGQGWPEIEDPWEE